MNIGIIGAGLIGRKRALALPKGVALKAIFDISKDLARDFAKEFKCHVATSLKEILSDKEIKAIMIATPNGFLAEIAVAAITAGKHVLIEKPGGIHKREIESIRKTFKKTPVVVHFGYNHRFHPAIVKAKSIIDSKKYGPVLFIRAKYGHGGRIGYEKEWRFNKKISGGGELIDQGSHLIDLTNFFIGPMDKVKSLANTFFWNTKLEDTAFILLSNKKGQVASLSVSCVEWKNIFEFEIMLKTAKIHIKGLGGSYGIEKLTLFKMRPEMGPPDEEKIKFEKPDRSWAEENKLFFDRIKRKDFSNKAFDQATYVMDIVEKVYRENSR